MTLNELLKTIKRDHEKMMQEAHDEMYVESCFHSYAFRYRGRVYEVEFNLLTLDFKAKNKMPVSLRSKIKHRMIQEEYLKWKFKKEGRAFFDFLRLKYDDINHIRITDCESPDFIIHDGLEHGYEVTEATDAHNAKFNEAMYLLTGMDHTTREFKVYIKHIEKSLKNKSKALETTPKKPKDIYARIIECIIKKAKKYKVYIADLDTRNVIVFNNRIAFRRQHDFDVISLGIRTSEAIKTSSLDSIFVISGTHDVMVEFDKFGHIKEVRRK